MKRKLLIIGISVFGAIATLVAGYFLALKPYLDSKKQLEETKINGLIYLIQSDPEDTVDGILKWERELKERNLTALVKASQDVYEKYPEVFDRLSDEGHIIAMGNPDVCWDMPYEEQYQVMKDAKEYMESLTGNPLRVFACKYSSYDENTLKAADALGIEFVLARGTEDVRAMIYKPDEYNVKLLEVSNVEFADMGKGSLCDASLFARGSTEEDFRDVFLESVEKAPDSMILVSHPYLGGTKAGYWAVYEEALGNEDVTWRPFNEWLDAVAVVESAYADIPENREVEYLVPTPAVPFDELEDLPDVGEKIVMFHNGTGSMCLDALAFFETTDYPLEEHLNTETGFNDLLTSYIAEFGVSEGVSTSFGYYPIIFIEDKAYSGFTDEIEQELSSIIAE